MPTVNIAVNVTRLTEFMVGNLISFADGESFGIVTVNRDGQLVVVDLTNLKSRRCLNDDGDMQDEFKVVCDYGPEYDIVVSGPCRLFQDASVLKPGSLAVYGNKLYLVITDIRSGVTCLSLSEGGALHPDRLGPVGCFESWALSVPRSHVAQSVVLYTHN